MLFKKLKLQNIRTYIDEEINFPGSSIMLSGDIGSGKSTVLIAMEFALFGILRGELSGESLLRKGCSEGSVELSFALNGREISIKRSLRKTAKGVQQTSGFITENNEKTEGTAVELKTRILSLLGYPPSLLAESKSLIYRYTVYTPQEEMKRIIQDDPEIRLDILRKVFNFDRYKLIKENANTFIASLREDILVAQAKTERLPEKKNEKKEADNTLTQAMLELESMLKIEGGLRNEKKKKQNEISAVEAQIGELGNFRQKLSAEEANHANTYSKIVYNAEKIAVMKAKKEAVETELSGMKCEGENELKLKIEALIKSISLVEQKERESLAKMLSLKEKIAESEKLMKKISLLRNCPMCFQPVNEEHKKHVLEEEQNRIISSTKEVEKLSKEKPDTAEKKQELDLFRQMLAKTDLIKYKNKVLAETEQSMKCLEEETEALKKNLVQIEQNKMVLKDKITVFSGADEMHKKLKIEYEEIIEKERLFYSKLAQAGAKKDGALIAIKKLEEEIKYLEGLSDGMKRKISLRNWVKEHFLNLVSLIERHVMLRIHREFSQLFKEWFDFMMEDESITARLDEKFTPIIEQNGYEISFADLSGGEKTSVALAYRLALSRVINDLISAINTKEIIILDEPTDGFSSGQLDRLKDILEQLKMKQAIIVSHESKVESFVQAVIRIAKNNGVSRVLSN
jgi:exonuclease SbcC